jgi:hypothetical protein
MNYLNIYTSIIENAKSVNRKRIKLEYFEKHHIVPKCIGGTNDATNLVLLTAKEHFICHHLLTKIYNNPKLKFAFWAMCNQLTGDVDRKYKITSAVYKKAKEIFAIENSKRHSGKKMPESHSIASSKRWKENNPNKPGVLSHFFGISKSAEAKAKISETKKNNPEKNAAFKGYYITPAGKFASSTLASEATGIFVENVRRRCSSPSTTINKRHLVSNKDLSSNDLGKSFKELGWDFLPAPCESFQPQ